MDSQTQANCREWCKSHYWQLQERRGWRYAFHESVMVRYYEEANLDPTLLEPLVAFLKGDGWQAGFTVHNKPVDMTGWKTRDVWYETREGDVKEATKLKRTRIYHAVYKEGTQGADGPYAVEDGCKWKVTHKFYWRVANLPTVPQGESGVQYRLQGVTRDDETGLWSCVIEKRETVRQDVAEYGTAATVFEERKEEQHLGVKQADVAATGKQAGAGGGTMVRRQVRKNEDCTSDITNETIEERPQAGAVTEETRTSRGTRMTTVNRNQAQKAAIGEGDMSVRNEQTDGGLWNQTITKFAQALGWFRATCRKTIFQHEHAETVAVDRDPGFTHVAAAGGGVIQEKTVSRNEERGYDIETRTREEQSVPGAVVETRKLIDGVQVTTVNRGQAAAASASGLKIGEMVRNEKTEGGLTDQTIVQASVEPVGRKEEACEQNALQHVHSRTEGMGSVPQAADTEAAHGQVKTRRVRLTERGAWDVTDETRTAKPAQTEVTVGTEGRQTTVTTYRNAPEIPVEPGGPNVETEATATPNEFGLKDGTVRTTTYSEKQATGGGGTEGTNVVTETHRDAPNAPQAEQGTVNKVVEVNVAPNDHGSYDWTKRTTQYSEKRATGGGGTEGTTVTTETHRDAPSAPQAEQGTVNKVVEVSVSPNDHGSYDWTKRTTEYAEKSATGGGGTAGTAVTTETHRDAPNAPQAEPGEVNKVVETSVTPNDHGSYDYTKRTTQYSEKQATAAGGTFLTNETRTVTENGTDGAPSEQPARGTAYDITAQPNDHGSFRVTKTRRDAVADSQSKTWQDVIDNGDTVTTYNCGIFVYRNQPSVPSAPSYQSIQCSLSINEFGLYDVIYHCRTFVDKVQKESGGQGTQGGTRSGNTRTIVKQYQKKDGDLYRRTYTVHYDMCWGGSQAWLAAQAAQPRTGGTVAGTDFPELGCITGMRGEIMYIYTGVDVGSEEKIGGSSGS